MERKSYYVSPRAGGEYEITSEAERALKYLGDTEGAQRIRARLTSWLTEMRNQGADWPLVTTDVIKQVRARRDLHPYERANRLLRYLADFGPLLGRRYQHDELSQLKMSAISESTDIHEVVFLIEFLEFRGFVGSIISADHTMIETQVTVGGHAQIAQIAREVDPARCFVAMWFGTGMNQVYERGIAPAVCDAGYEPHIINRDPTVDKVDDAIVAAIRKAKFVVADCTHGDDGVRGSVYYEIGFAHGLGKEVIFTCRNDLIDGIHFDIRQHFQIGWTRHEDLIRPLRDRIIARVGTGPHFVDRGE